jgi:hypothetical protein
LPPPEGKEFASDSDEAWVASLAIDFCAGYVDGRPLRWSPVVVELFMANWIPRKVLADQGLFERLPPALDAWVRFAGRKAGTPHWALQATRNAIPRWRNQMVERGSDPAARGPGKQFLTAAKAAGLTSRMATRCERSWRAGTRAARRPDATPRELLAYYCRWVLTLFSKLSTSANSSSHSHTRPHLRSFSRLSTPECSSC